MARNSCVAVLPAAVWAMIACDGLDAPEAHGERFDQADRLFQSDPRWVGGDGAYSIDLRDGRVLWLFGDTLLARRPFEREAAYFVRNSAAIQYGYDPSTSAIRFYWGTQDGEPTEFARAVNRGPHTTFWPAHGAEHNGSLLLFYEVVVDPPGGLGDFRSIAWTAFLIRDIQGSPETWVLEELAVPDTGSWLVGEALLVEPPWLYAFASDDDAHPLRLARFPLAEAMRGELFGLEWWCGSDWCSEDAETLIGIGAPEFSVHYDAGLRRYLMVYSAGVGPTTLAIRSAESPWGPWSDPRDLLRPPESFVHGAQVYAGKAHPELEGGGLLATYVETERYVPQFVRIVLR